MFSYTLLAAALASTSAAAGLKGFNYGSTDSSGAIVDQQGFENLFKTASSLENAEGFDSARLYTMIQGGTQNTPISAIPAAIATKTKLLLGLWSSAGDAIFENELTALKQAIAQYGSEFTDLVVGISVGSEDLYRDSQMGIDAKAGIGKGPDVIVNYIKQVKNAISNTPLSKAPIGHVDTWTAWVNGTNAEVIDNVDWLGFDGYPYFQNTMPNSIDVGKDLFWDSVDQTKNAAKGKEVWIAETGWPVSGKQENEGIASPENAKTFWDEVGCDIFGKYNTFWYTLYDKGSSPSFGVVGSVPNGKPNFDLSCKNVKAVSSSSVASSSTAAVSSSSVAASSSSVAASSSVAPSSSAVASSSAAASSAVARSSFAAASSSVAVSSGSSIRVSSAGGVASSAVSSLSAGVSSKVAAAPSSANGSTNNSGSVSTAPVVAAAPVNLARTAILGSLTAAAAYFAIYL